MYNSNTITQLALNAADSELYKRQLMTSYKEHHKTLEQLKECKKEQEISNKQLIDSSISELDLIRDISNIRMEFIGLKKKLQDIQDKSEMNAKMIERRSRKGRGEITRFSS